MDKSLQFFMHYGTYQTFIVFTEHLTLVGRTLDLETERSTLTKN
jgi:hypothetical protein